MIIQAAVVIICSWLMVKVTYAHPISSNELIYNATQHDGETVTYEGEVIGDIMKRGDRAWINVHDGQTAIGVWIHASLVKDIVHTGSYESKGDRVEITGVFHRACIEHGGDMDIHAQAVRKIAPGRQVIEELDRNKRDIAIMLLGILAAIWISGAFKRE
jgi:hypothetical protein